jgi:tRNA-2-methylthio-N6-dimethylallyladenosine synthase
LFIQCFGCQMNEYDSGRMYEILAGEGYQRSSSAETADLIIINTCSIREKAEAKVYSAIGRFGGLKRRRPRLLLAVGGCVAQQEGAALLAQAHDVDLVFGPDAIPRLPQLLRRVEAERAPLADVAFTEVGAYRFLDAAPEPAAGAVTALVTVQKGCDNACAYCVVPRVRGPEVSRPAAQVVAEVERFVAAGVREVTLIGQNVNSYRGYASAAAADRATAGDAARGDAATGAAGAASGDDFARLLAQVDAVPGLSRLRFTTSHPRDLGPRLAQAMARLPRLCEWVHLPLQAGSSRVLSAMRRGYSADDYLARVELLRAAVPGIALTSDIIVGFPGESDADFGETLRLMAAVEFDSVYSFRFSPRPGTEAALLADDVPAAVKAERLREVQSLQQRITTRKLAGLVGRRLEVLVEGKSARGGGLCGRTRGNQVVNFELPARGPEVARGQLVEVEIVAARAHTLAGRLAVGQGRGPELPVGSTGSVEIACASR